MRAWRTGLLAGLLGTLTFAGGLYWSGTTGAHAPSSPATTTPAPPASVGAATRVAPPRPISRTGAAPRRSTTTTTSTSSTTTTTTVEPDPTAEE